MRQILLTIAIFSILAILPFDNFAQGSQSVSTEMRSHIEKLNQFLKTIDDNYYGFVELKNGSLFINRKNDDVIYFKLSDISDVRVITEKTGQVKVAFNCKNDSECVYSGKKKYKYMTFWKKGSFDSETAFRLSKNLFETYLAENGLPKSEPTASNPQTFIEKENTKPTPTATTVAVSTKSGSFEDCKIILSDACRNYLLQSTVDEIIPQIQGKYDKSNGNFVSKSFQADYEVSSGGIIAAHFSSYHIGKRGKIASNLKMGDSMKDVIKKYGTPLDEYVGKNSYFVRHFYKDFELIYLGGVLDQVTFRRNRTQEELVALKEREDHAKRTEAYENSPEVLARSLQSEYNALVEKIESDVREANILIAEHNNIKAAGVSFIDYAREGRQRDIRLKVDGMKRELVDSIEKFLKKYKSVIPENMRQQLLASQAKFKSFN